MESIIAPYGDSYAEKKSTAKSTGVLCECVRAVGVHEGSPDHGVGVLGGHQIGFVAMLPDEDVDSAVNV